ncbi:MAG: PAS domain S-box protein [Bacteroidota bacterium]
MILFIQNEKVHSVRFLAYKRHLFENSSDSIVVINIDGKIYDLNPITESITGILNEHLIDTDFSSYFTEPWKVKEICEQVVSLENKVQDSLLTIRHSSGSSSDVIANISAYRDEKARAQRIFIVLRDISKQKKTEKQLAESESIVQTIFEAAPDAVIVIDNKGTIVKWNPKSENIFGWTSEEVIGRSLSDTIIPHRYRERHEKGLSSFLETGEEVVMTGTVQIQALHKNNTLFDIALSISPMVIDGQQLFIGFIRDITEHKKAEDEIKLLNITLEQRVEQRTSELRKSFDELSDYKHALDESAIVDIADENGIIRYVNDNFCTISKFSRMEILGQDQRTMCSDYHSKAFVSELWETIARGGVWRGELKNRAKDGTFYWADTTIVPFLNEQDIPYQYVTIGFNITQRKKIEEQQALNELIISSSDDAILSVDLNGIINSWNRGAEIIFGHRDKEALGKHISLIIPENLINEEKEIASKIRQKGYLKDYETQRIRKDKSLIDISLTVSPIKDLTGNIIGTSTIARNITESKLAKDKLVKSEIQIRNFAQHLNKVLEDERSYIAREIHDELGQQLAGLKMGLSFYKKRDHEDSKIEEITNNLMKDVDNTIQSLRKIATELRPGILDTMGLIPSIHWLVKEFEKKTGIKCIIETSITEDLIERNISTCFFRICQEALTNISKHAEASEVGIEVNQNKDVLTLKIKDNGKGIANEKFENPFSMGLLGMQERANIIGAVLIIKSRENVGTIIQLSTKLK